MEEICTKACTKCGQAHGLGLFKDWRRAQEEGELLTCLWCRVPALAQAAINRRGSKTKASARSDFHTSLETHLSDRVAENLLTEEEKLDTLNHLHSLKAMGAADRARKPPAEGDRSTDPSNDPPLTFQQVTGDASTTAVAGEHPATIHPAPMATQQPAVAATSSQGPLAPASTGRHWSSRIPRDPKSSRAFVKALSDTASMIPVLVAAYASGNIEKLLIERPQYAALLRHILTAADITVPGGMGGEEEGLTHGVGAGADGGEPSEEVHGGAQRTQGQNDAAEDGEMEGVNEDRNRAEADTSMGAQEQSEAADGIGSDYGASDKENQAP
ncbi:MAG: hypothetical protein M1831_000992 [Alyxoria varia]|nr:MAG: hypothetical protein M1831_000992 [Alyxoria varia]